MPKNYESKSEDEPPQPEEIILDALFKGDETCAMLLDSIIELMQTTVEVETLKEVSGISEYFRILKD